MSTDTWLAFALFAFVSSITPGPNNTMLLASGVNFGFVRSLPHMAGVTVGFCLMILLMGLGLGSVFVRFPVLYTVLRYVGGTYMLYLAWKIFRSQPASSTDNNTTAAQPMGFTAAAAFQWVNPKAWVMALGSVTTYLPAQHTPWQLLALVELLSDDYSSDRVIDVQWQTPHLATLGVIEIERDEYLALLEEALGLPEPAWPT